MESRMYFIYIRIPGGKRFHVFDPYNAEYGMGLMFAPRFTLEQAKSALEWLRANHSDFDFQYRPTSRCC